MEDSVQRSVCHPLRDGVEADQAAVVGSDPWAMLAAVRAFYVAELIAVLRMYRSMTVHFAPIEPGYYPA